MTVTSAWMAVAATTAAADDPHLLARVYINELGFAQRLQVNSHVAVAFGGGVAAAPHALASGRQSLGAACVGGFDDMIRVGLVGERHNVADHKFDACCALQVLHSVNAAVTCRSVDVIHSIVGHNMAATLQCKGRLVVRCPRRRKALVLALLVQTCSQRHGSCGVERSDLSDS